MDYTALLGIALQLADGAIKGLKSKSAQMTSEQIENVEAALASLQKFHGTAVTAAQLDSLKG